MWDIWLACGWRSSLTEASTSDCSLAIQSDSEPVMVTEPSSVEDWRWIDLIFLVASIVSLVELLGGLTATQYGSKWVKLEKAWSGVRCSPDSRRTTLVFSRYVTFIILSERQEGICCAIRSKNNQSQKEQSYFYYYYCYHVLLLWRRKDERVHKGSLREKLS